MLSHLGVSARVVTQCDSEKPHSWPADASGGMRRHPISSYFLNRDPNRALYCYIYDSVFGNGKTSCQIPANRGGNEDGAPRAWERWMG